MGRVNKTIEGVFTNIVGTSSEISTYNQFINQGEDLYISKELQDLTDTYVKLVNESKNTFEQLASLEEIIMQMRIKENLDDIKLSLVREYIYARTPFYRKDKKAKDVRVIVDKIEFHPQVGTNIEILFGNEEFMARAKEKLVQSMDSEIKENIRLLKQMLNS